MSKKKNQHVVPHDKGWAVKGEGNKKPTKVTKTQKEAIEIAKEIAKNKGGEVVIYSKKGQIRDKDSYGHDPCPPKDKKY